MKTVRGKEAYKFAVPGFNALVPPFRVYFPFFLTIINSRFPLLEEIVSCPQTHFPHRSSSLCPRVSEIHVLLNLFISTFRPLSLVVLYYSSHVLHLHPPLTENQVRACFVYFFYFVFLAFPLSGSFRSDAKLSKNGVFSSI